MQKRSYDRKTFRRRVGNKLAVKHLSTTWCNQWVFIAKNISWKETKSDVTIDATYQVQTIDSVSQSCTNILLKFVYSQINSKIVLQVTL